MQRLTLRFLIVAVVCAVVMAGGNALGSAWYHDDACLIAQWKCDAGFYGLFGLFFGGFFTALFTLAAGVTWGLGKLARRKHRTGG